MVRTPGPGGMRMHLYVPDVRPANPAIVVAMHGCGGSGPGFYSGSEFAAGSWGLAIILLTFVVKLLLFPVTYKSVASMRRVSSSVFTAGCFWMPMMTAGFALCEPSPRLMADPICKASGADRESRYWNETVRRR